MKLVTYAAGAIVVLHGLVHLMGFVAYWPLGSVAELPYKTALLAGRLEVGAAGMKVFAALWLLAAAGFVAGAAGFLAQWPWWSALTLGTLVLSTTLIALDWAPAFRGAVVNAVLLALMGLLYWSSSSQRS